VLRLTAFEESCAQADVMIWCDGAAIVGTQWCGSGVVIHWTPGEQHHESIATAASSYRAEMIAILTLWR